MLNIHLIDVVSGAVVTSLTHRRAKGPVHMVHSENWLVYSYYNDKVRRTEMSKKLFWLLSSGSNIVWFVTEKKFLLQFVNTQIESSTHRELELDNNDVLPLLSINQTNFI